MKIYTRNNLKEMYQNLNLKSIFIVPTDTIYGISGAIANIENKHRINEIKKRPKNKELIILVSNLKQAKQICQISLKAQEMLLSSKPTTVLCPKNYSGSLFHEYLSDNDLIGLRICKNKIIKKIIKKIGPIFSTSANLSNQDYRFSLAEFKKIKVDFICFLDKSKNSASYIYNSIKKIFER